MLCEINLYPVLSSVQKIALYETKNKLFIVGSNNDQTRFRILKIDRTEPCDLHIVEDGVEYSEKEVNHVLLGGIKTKGSSATLPKPISAFGIVGFVRFLEGYYLILVTKRRQVASIGLHVIYKIEDTCLIPVPHEYHRIPHHDESRYLKMFQSIDLSSNFYFSYSYDITHSIQMNTVIPRTLQPDEMNAEAPAPKIIPVYGVRFEPNRRFVWNNHLLSKLENEISPEWILYIMHGFIGQSNVSIFGRSVYVTLIARRSSRFAGTRFLKRGANYKGDVANEVETEQMVIDLGISSSRKMRVSSFVQMRGSVPSQWSQDMTKMVAKPAIIFDVSDPFHEIAGAHFNELFRRYGSPIKILNLVKTREKKKHESQLSEQFNSAVSYLNLFLPPIHRIEYISFDMARMNKGKVAKVMDRLARIAGSVISKTGFFVMNGPLVDNKVMDKIKPENSFQTGIIRVNCVDCLDRTNTAQFALGKCALAYQLYFLGLLSRPSLEFDSDCVRLLEVLYEDHGDTLALQYGGSQLVHRIKTYRKTAPWTSQGNDIMQTLSRYYRNTFSDAEKQHAINLFLGLYVPKEQNEPIWEQPTDYYLHHPECIGELQPKKNPLTKWWDQEILDCLPAAYDSKNRQCLQIQSNLVANSEAVDIYAHFHKTDKISVLTECFEFIISHSIRDIMPQCVTDFSPFIVRVRPGRMREQTTKSGKSGNMKNPSLTGKSSTSSNTSSSSEDSGSEEEEECHHSISQYRFRSMHKTTEIGKLKAENVYGIDERSFQICERDNELYRKFEEMGKFLRGQSISGDVMVSIETKSRITETTIPIAKEKSINIYQKYIDKLSINVVSEEIIASYKNYVNDSIEYYRTIYKNYKL